MKRELYGAGNVSHMSITDAAQGEARPSFHTRDPQDVLSELDVVAGTGLSSADAAHRLDRHGRNELVEKEGIQPFRILLNQFTDTMVIVLMVAAVIAAAIGDTKDAIVILVIVVLNAILGFVQVKSRSHQGMTGEGHLHSRGEDAHSRRLAVGEKDGLAEAEIECDLLHSGSVETFEVGDYPEMVPAFAVTGEDAQY